MIGQAPAGFYTCLDVKLRLANGRIYDYRWSTPMALHRALHKGPQWARQALTEEKVPGRSKIVGIEVRATYQAVVP